MKLKLKPCTIEELQEELEHNLIDLMGDVLLLECICHCMHNNMEVPKCFDGRVTEECLRRLSDYIDQHTDEVNSICGIMVRAQK